MANTVIYNKTRQVMVNCSLDQYPPYYPRYHWAGSDVFGTIVCNRTPAVTSGYRALKKAGRRLKPLAYYISETFSSINYGTNTMYYNASPRYIISVERRNITQPSAVANGTLSSADSLRSSAYNLCVIPFLNGLKDSKFNSAQAYTEAHQVQRLVGDTAKTLASVFQHLRKGQLSAAGSRLGLIIGKRQHARFSRDHKRIKTVADIDRLLANGVLAVQYGIRPLIQDVIGAAELYAQKSCEEVVNSFTHSKTLRVNETVYAFGMSSQGTTRRVSTLTGTVRVKMGCTFAKGNEVLHTVKQLGLTNPLLLAWELMPWSFVIDWFIPFGNFLSSIDATLGLDFKDGYVSTKTDLVWKQDQVLSPAGAYSAFAFSGTSAVISYDRSFKRTVMSSFPSTRLPQFKNPLSWEHAMNGIALLTGFKKTAYVR